jgi:sugar O-acyltransferase (sialic acid O-acetyltransferase NeuD family)
MATAKPPLYIVGAGGHAKVASDCAEQCGYQQIYMLDDQFPTLTLCGRWSVVGKPQLLETIDLANVHCFVAIGNNKIRETVLKQLTVLNAHIATLIHPTAVIGTDVVIGQGTLIMANTVVNAFTQIGQGCILNTSSSVDHDGQIADCVHIAPGVRLAGSVTVRDKTFIGIGSAVIQQVCIGANVTVGAGSTVIRTVPDDSVVVGSPAKLLKK